MIDDFAEKFKDPAEVLAALREIADPANYEPEGQQELAAATLKLLVGGVETVLSGLPTWIYVAVHGVYAESYVAAAYLDLDEAKATEGKGEVRWRQVGEAEDWSNGLSEQARVELQRVELLAGQGAG